MIDFKCRICGKNEYRTLFRYQTPLAGNVSEKGAAECSVKYDLEPVVCLSCGHVQLKNTLDVDMYEDYLYTPSFAPEFHSYIDKFTDSVTDMFKSKADRFAVEIGSSNGYLLKKMQEKGWRTLGFEPSQVLSEDAEKNGIHTVTDYFDAEAWQKLPDDIKSSRPDVFIIRHVMEHLDDLNGITGAIAEILDDNGFLIIEVPYLRRIISEKQFYAFFHEHLSYFSVTSLKNLLEPHGLYIRSIEENDLEGGSILIFASKSRGGSSNAEEYLKAEEEAVSTDKIIQFSENTGMMINELKNKIKELKKDGRKTAAWGAGQRGCTLVSMCSLTSDDIEFIVDVNENYQGKYAAGTSIRIVSPEYLKEHFVNSIIIFATGYADEIEGSNREYISRGGKFIRII